MSWRADSVRLRLWMQLRLRALNATEAKAAVPDATAKAVDNALYTLKSEGFTEHQPDGRYQVTAKWPPLPEGFEHPEQQTAALDLVADCPGGIDEWLLVRELNMPPRHVRALLADSISQQRVRRVDLPSGVIRYLPIEAAA